VAAGTDWIYAAFVAGLLALGAFGSYRAGLILQQQAPPANLLLNPLDNLLRLVLVGLCFLVGARLGPGPSALGWSLDRLPRDLAVGLAAGLALALLLNALGRLAVRRWGEQIMPTRMLQCMLPADGREWAGVLLALLPAALLEELIFRSLPLGGLGWLISPWLLLWPLALLFGLLHWPQGGWGVAATALAAVLLSLLFLTTGSLWAALTAHYVMNVHQLIEARRQGLAPLRAAPVTR
jgi:membrane protease YdiL (CAAX protease family)